MAPKTTRFVTRNHGTTSSMSIMTASPPQDPLYPASNLRNPDRFIVWGCPATGGDVAIGLNIGAGRTTHCVGILGFVNDSAGVFPNTWKLDAGAVWPRDGTWVSVVPARTLAASIGIVPLGTKRDDVVVLGAPVTHRYWEYTFGFNSLAGFSWGLPLIASLEDLGIAYSSDSTETMLLQRVRQVTVSGNPSVTEVGRPRSRRVMQFRSITEAMLTKIRQFVASTPNVIVDPFDVPIHVQLVEDSMVITHRFGPPDLYDVELAVESMS